MDGVTWPIISTPLTVSDINSLPDTFTRVARSVEGRREVGLNVYTVEGEAGWMLGGRWNCAGREGRNKGGEVRNGKE